MKKNLLVFSMFAGLLLFASCASKKDLQNCQLENKELQKNNENVKDQLSEARQQLAAANARVTTTTSSHSRRKIMPLCSSRSTRASPTPAPTTSTSQSLLTRLTSRTSISVTW